jgi:aminoglycoside 3-N-acetyltransferase
MSDFDIHKSLSDIGIEKDDIVMIHGDAGVAAQYREIPVDSRLDHLIDEMKSYFSTAGSILVPAFTYSFTKNEYYDVLKTPSSVGLFSERFRHGSDVKRSRHPIFSVSTWGKFGGDFLEGRNDDCFGPGTFFEMLLERNVKLVTLGCSLNSVTFVHYVEQRQQVSYRFMKTFSGKIIEGDDAMDVNTNYYVRDMALKTGCNLALFGKVVKESELLRVGTAGRFPLQVINSLDFFTAATDLLSASEYSLIDEGVVNDDI